MEGYGTLCRCSKYGGGGITSQLIKAVTGTSRTILRELKEISTNTTTNTNLSHMTYKNEKNS